VGCRPAGWLVPGSVPLDRTMCLSGTAHRARAAEGGKLDLVFLATSATVRNHGKPAVPREREHGRVKIEPLSLLAAIATSINEIGLSESVLSAAVGR
jgi:N-acetyl-S-(2-succino)cysteine monooxygenase